MGFLRKFHVRKRSRRAVETSEYAPPVIPEYAKEAFDLLQNWLDGKALEPKNASKETLENEKKEAHAQLVQLVAGCLLDMRQVGPLAKQFHVVESQLPFPGPQCPGIQHPSKMVVYLNSEHQPLCSSEHWRTFAPSCPISISIQQIWVQVAEGAGAQIVLLFPQRGITSLVPPHWVGRQSHLPRNESYTVVSIDHEGSIRACSFAMHVGDGELIKMCLGLPFRSVYIAATEASEQINPILGFPGAEEWFKREVLNLPAYLRGVIDGYKA